MIVSATWACCCCFYKKKCYHPKPSYTKKQKVFAIFLTVAAYASFFYFVSTGYLSSMTFSAGLKVIFRGVYTILTDVLTIPPLVTDAIVKIMSSYSDFVGTVGLTVGTMAKTAILENTALKGQFTTLTTQLNGLDTSITNMNPEIVSISSSYQYLTGNCSSLSTSKYRNDYLTC
jgi:hypothetical protein